MHSTRGSIGNAAPHQIAIAVIAPTSGAMKAVGDRARAAVHLAVDGLHDDESRRLDISSIDVIEVDGGDGTLPHTYPAADRVKRRTDIVAVIIAMPADIVDMQLRALAGTDAATLQTSPDALGYADVDVPSPPGDVAIVAGELIGGKLGARHPAMVSSVQVMQPLATTLFGQSVQRFGPAPIEQTFPFTASGGIDPLGDLAAGGVDAVYLGPDPDRLESVIREAGLHQLTAVFVLPPAWDLPETRDLVEHAGADAYLIVPFAADTDSGPAHDFAGAFRQRTGEVADAAAAMAYDAAEIAIEAVRHADDAIDPKSVRAATRDGLVGVPGANGPLVVGMQGVVHRALVVRELHNGVDQPAFLLDP